MCLSVASSTWSRVALVASKKGGFGGVGVRPLEGREGNGATQALGVALKGIRYVASWDDDI